jgi:hypothetical protein
MPVKPYRAGTKRRSIDMDVHSLFVAVSCVVAGSLMALAGLDKSALEPRRRRRRCPSCGRALVHGRGCGCSSR